MDKNQLNEAVEVIAVDENGQIDTVSMEYNEYRSELVNLYHRTTMDNSVVSSFLVNGSTYSHSLAIIDKENNQRILKTHDFIYGKGFLENFIFPMLDDYKRENFIYDSKIEVLNENSANLVIRTKLNDKLIFLGISVELANKINDLIVKKEEQPETKLNQNGFGSSLAIGLLLSIIGIIMIVIAMIIKK